MSIVTAPTSANARPQSIVAAVFSVTLWSAMMLPANAVLVPSVAELPTCQNTSPASPFTTLTDEPLAVVSELNI